MFKFSVIIVIEDSDSWLKETIDSIVGQSIGFKKYIQLILVNAGNLESAENLCLDYKAQYPKNVKYIKTEYNMGRSESRNNAFEHVRGEYVSYIGCND